MPLLKRSTSFDLLEQGVTQESSNVVDDSENNHYGVLMKSKSQEKLKKSYTEVDKFSNKENL